MADIDIDEFRSYLKLDKHALDQELEEHPVLLFKISEAYVQAAAHRDMLKEQLATVDAGLFDNYRRKPVKDKERITDTSIKTAVQADRNHEKAATAYLTAKNQADLLLALKEAFQSRGYMIKDLCSLYTSNYYESESVKPNGNTTRTTYISKREKRGLP